MHQIWAADFVTMRASRARPDHVGIQFRLFGVDRVSPNKAGSSCQTDCWTSPLEGAGLEPSVPALARTLPCFDRNPLVLLAGVVPICLRGGGEVEEIEGAALGLGGGGEDSGEAIAPEADDIAGERGEIAEQGMEAVHRE
jgi:hypothetical protein